MPRRLFYLPGTVAGVMRRSTHGKNEGLAWVCLLLALIAPAGFMAFRTYQSYVILLLTGLLGVAACAVLLYKPIWGLFSLVAAGHLAPYSSEHFNPVVILAPLLIGLWLFDMIILKREIRFARCRPIPPLLIFCAVAVLSFIIGQFPWYPTDPAPLLAQLAGLAIFGLSAGVFLLAVHQIKTPRQLEQLTWFFVALASALIAVQKIPIASDWVRTFLGAYPLGNSIWLWLIAFAATHAWWNRMLRSWQRVALGAIAVYALWFRALQATTSVSGWVPALVALGVIFLLRMPRAGLFVGLAGGALLLANLETIIGLFMSQESYSLTTRWEAALIMADMIKVNPVLGLGPANYYPYSSLHPIMGWYVPFNSHNNYLDILAQTGMCGLVLFFWFMLELGRMGRRLLTSLTPGSFQHLYIVAALAALIGILVSGLLGDWILPFVYNGGLTGFRASVLTWLFLGGIVVIHRFNADGRVQELAS